MLLIWYISLTTPLYCAIVHHAESYSDLRASNVTGTQHILNFCLHNCSIPHNNNPNKLNNLKTLLYVSTLNVTELPSPHSVAVKLINQRHLFKQNDFPPTPPAPSVDLSAPMKELSGLSGLSELSGLLRGHSGYVVSKWVSEVLIQLTVLNIQKIQNIQKYRNLAFPAMIVRPGLIGPCSESGASNPAQVFDRSLTTPNSPS